VGRSAREGERGESRVVDRRTVASRESPQEPAARGSLRPGRLRDQILLGTSAKTGKKGVRRKNLLPEATAAVKRKGGNG